MNDKKEYKEIVSTADEVTLLLRGEKVACLECGKGIYQPFGTTDASKAHCFICDHCGSHIHLDPNVVVE